MKVSIVLRTHNEEKTVGEVFEMLSKQSFKNFELILVDNSSTDKTLQIAKKYKIDRFINIPEGKFSHPKSLNDAIKKAKGDLIVIINGHTVPITTTWLEDGLKNFENPKVAAINGYYTDKYTPKTVQIRYDWSNMSNTNSIIRKDLWEKYNFDEDLSGVEDYDWGLEWMSRGYKIVKDPKFSVKHYHEITPEIRKYWAEMVDKIEKKKRNAPLVHKIIYQIKKTASL